MFVYIANYLACSLWVFARNNKVVVLALCLQFFLILACRSDDFGVDLREYSRLFDSYSAHSFVEIIKSFRLFANSNIALGRESGFVLINWIFGNSGFNFHDFLVFQSAVCIASLGFFVYRFSKMPWLSFALIIALSSYTYMFCIIRQSLAVAFLYFSLPFIKERKFFKFIFVVLLASLFHVVSVLFIPLYWISRIHISLKNICCGIFISIASPFLMKGFVEFFLKFMGKSYAFSTEITMNSMVVVFFVILFNLCFFKKNLFLNEKSNDVVIFWCFFLSFPVQIMGMLMPILGRASTGIFFPFSAILIPNLIFDNCDSNGKVCFALTTFCLFFVYFLIVFNASFSYLIPYESYYFK